MSDVSQQSTDQDEAAAAEAPEADPTVAERSSQETRVRSADTRSASAEARADVSAGPTEGSSATSAEDADEPAEDEETTLEGEAEIAADYLEELLDIADLDGDIDTYIEGDRAHVSIVSESTVLVGDRGEVLDALQELTRLAVMTETGDRSRLMLDVAGFRERRRKQLLAFATAAVEQAKTTRQGVPLEAMNPFERKIVHDAVAAAGLTSESEGDEPNRHVVVHAQA